MPTVIERHQSRNYSNGTATFLYAVVGATDEVQAATLADAEAPDEYRGMHKGTPSVMHVGGGFYHVDFDYTYRREAEPGTGNAPPTQGSGQEGGGNTSPPGRADEAVGPELSFSTGGATKRIYISKETMHKIGPPDLNGPTEAPDFKNLIGVSKSGVEGCEVIASDPKFTITQKLESIKVGYLCRLLAMTGTANDDSWRGMAEEELVFEGADGSYSGGPDEKYPWTISGHFHYFPSKFEPEQLKFGDLEFPFLHGTWYVWFQYKEKTEEVGGKEYQISVPQWGYAERVYDLTDFTLLGMGQ